MRSLVKYNLYRTLHDKSVYVCLGILAVLAALPTFAAFMMNRVFDLGEELSSAPLLDVALDRYSFTLLMLVIAVTGIVSADEKNGYVKNIIGQCRFKKDNFVAKVISLFFVELLFFFSAFAVSLVVTLVLQKPSALIEGNPAMYLARTLVLLFLIYAFVVLAAMLTTVLKKRVWALLICLALALGTGGTVLSVVDLYWGTKLGDYELVNLMSAVMDSGAGADFAKALVMGLAVGAAALVIGCVVTEKRDAI